MKRLYWPAVAFMVLLHALAALAFFLPVRPGWVAIAVALYLVLGLCTNMALHRMLSHRAFSCPRWLEYTLVSIAMMNAQGSPLTWVAIHRRHHAYSDREEDPSSPKESFWYGHIGWTMDDLSSHPDDWKRWSRDLGEDRYYHWLMRWRFVPMGLTIATVGLTLGWAAVPLVYFVPVVLWMHSIYSISSFCHRPAFGSAPYDTRDDSRNVWWLGVLILGDGWHNNHHAFPFSARHGLGRFQVDLSAWVIEMLERVGLAWNVRRPSPEALARLNSAKGQQLLPVEMEPPPEDFEERKAG